MGIAAVLAGCGSGSGLTMFPGASILTPAVVRATFASPGGGYGPQTPVGAACVAGAFSYVVSLPDHTVSSSSCAVNGSYDDPASYTLTNQTTMLDSDRWAAIREVLAAVRVSGDEMSCGADAPDRSLDVETQQADLVYGDDFYACLKEYRDYVTYASLNDLEAALTGL
jgi:hypothetical protein